MNEYIGARYVPKFMDTYDATTSYENMCVVDNGMGTSYISKKPVPAGTPLTNTEYWAIYGASNGAIVHLQEQIDILNDNNVTPQMFGAVGDGLTDDTVAIQNAIDSSYKVYFPKGVYRITMSHDRFYRHNYQDVCYGLKIENNDLYFEDCVIKMDGHDSPYYFMIFLYNAVNTHIHGKVTFIGDRSTNTGGDNRGEGHVIAVMHGDNITIEDIVVKNAWGDGIWLMNDGYDGDELTAFPKNININNVFCDHNRRNGLAICCGENISVSNSKFNNSTGTDPKLGIDVEANGPGYALKNITINNVTSYGCTNGGFATTMKTDDDSVSWNNAISDGSFALTIDNTCNNGLFSAANLISGESCATFDPLILVNKGTDCTVNVNNVFCKPHSGLAGLVIANHQGSGRMNLANIEVDADNLLGTARESGIFVYDANPIYDLSIENMRIYNGSIYKPFVSTAGLAVPAGNNCDIELSIVDTTITYNDGYYGFYHNEVVTNDRLKYYNKTAKLIDGSGQVRGNYSKYIVDGTLTDVYLKNLIAGTHYVITNTSNSVDVGVNMYSPQVRMAGGSLANFFIVPHGHSAEVWLNEDENIYNGIIF